MTTPNIDTISMLPFGMLNAFLVSSQNAAIVVDTGLPNSESKINRALHRRGLNWSHVKLAVITHAHIDHAGSARAMRTLTSAPILTHQDEIPYCEGRAPLLRPTGTFGRLFQKTGVIERRFDYLTPDIIMEGDEMDLSDFGFSARAVHTPGHTPGSLSIIFEDGAVFAGDLAASGILLGGIALRGRPKRPPFEENSDLVAASLERLIALGGRHFFLGHGGPLPADTIKKHIARLRKKAA